MKGWESVKLSRKLTSTLHVASVLALAVALVPLLSSPALAGGTITQTGPGTGTTTTTGSSSFGDVIATTGGVGLVSFVADLPSTPPGLSVDSTGNVSTTGTLAENIYTLTGTDSDLSSDTGTWTYILTVNAVTIAQSPPTENAAAVTPAESGSFTNQLETSGGTGSVTYVQVTGSTDLTVSSSGEVTAASDLPVSGYTATGTDSDIYGDTGSWTYTLNVTGATITQSPPTHNAALVTPTDSRSFTDQLVTSGAIGSVSYGQSTGSPSVSVSSSGAVTVGATLAAGAHTATGTDSDIYGDSGTWAYTVNVTATGITQSSPTTNSTAIVTPPTSTSFTAQLATTGGDGTILYSQSTGNPDLTVSSSGAIKVVTPLVVGSYPATGTDVDSYGDSGTWTYTLNVTAGTIGQSSPIGNGAPLTPAGTGAFVDQLDTSGVVGDVTYVVTVASSPTGLLISPSGTVSTTGPLATGNYTISGSDSDTSGDTGAWSYLLTVRAAPISQSVPLTNSVTPAASAGYTQQLVTKGNAGAVKFVTTSSTRPPGVTRGLAVSPSGKVTTTGALAAGTYSASGTDSDGFGDSGTWAFTLTVAKTAITQTGPFSNPNKITPASSSRFTAQLKTTETTAKVRFVTTASHPPGLVVSSSGAVTTKGALAAGTYAVSGTDSDGLGDNGTWGLSLTVTATKIAQQSPTSAATNTGKTFAGKLKVTGFYGPVNFAQSSGKPALTISSKGVVTALSDLKAGTYKATGTASDHYRDGRGDWSFTLTVTATKLAQAAPSSGATTTGKAFKSQLVLSGSHGTVSFSQATGAPHLKVSSSGSVTAPSSLPKGTYKAAGTVSDGLGDTGSWSFTLTVTSASIKQLAPGSAETAVGKGFTGRLKVKGAIGRVTYTQSSGAPHVKVSSSGAISAPANLARGTYKATGSARDTDDDSGTWSFTLTVSARRLVQLAPLRGASATGTAFRATLKLSGTHGRVTYSQSSGAPHLLVSSSGAVSASAGLAAGTYKATGGASDSYGDTGSWSFVLTVSAHKLAQLVPVLAKIRAGTAFKVQLDVSGAHGSLTYTQSVGAPRILVSSSGALSALASLAGGTYKASGSVRDSLGDIGAWSFELTVVASKLAQLAPDTATINAGKAFASQLKVSGAHGRVVYTESKGAPHLKVSPSGAISALASLASGRYKATGTDKDGAGDTGKWTFTLTVKATGLTQVAPMSAKITSGRAFRGQLKVSGERGKVTFTQLTDAQVMTVSSSGKISAPATLAPATYIVTGTAKDKLGDSCKWSFTLTVGAVVLG